MYVCVCVCVTIQLSLDQVHPGADLMLDRLDVLQQVQLTLGHRCRVSVLVRMFTAVGVCVVLTLYTKVTVRICARVCGGVSWWFISIFRLDFLQKQRHKPNSYFLNMKTNE